MSNENLGFLRAMPGLHARDSVLQFDLFYVSIRCNAFVAKRDSLAT